MVGTSARIRRKGKGMQRGALIVERLRGTGNRRFTPDEIMTMTRGVSVTTIVDGNVPLDVLTLDEEWASWFLAAKAFVAYKRRGGVRRSPLPDFYVGAHAAMAGHTLLTRDATRYRSYARRLRLVAP